MAKPIDREATDAYRRRDVGQPPGPLEKGGAYDRARQEIRPPRVTRPARGRGKTNSAGGGSSGKD